MANYKISEDAKADLRRIYRRGDDNPNWGSLFKSLFVNVVVWPRLYEKQRAEILGASVLAVDGVLETDGDVHHLIADRVHDFSHLAGNLASKSRDFC